MQFFTGSARTVAEAGLALGVAAVTARLAGLVWTAYARSPQAAAAMRR